MLLCSDPIALLKFCLCFSKVPFEERVFTVLQWLQLPEDQRSVCQHVSLLLLAVISDSVSIQTRLLHLISGGT